MSEPLLSPAAAATASVIAPGLGQLCNGERAKGITLLAIFAFVVCACIMRTDILFRLLMCLAYVCIAVPAAKDAYHTAAGHGQVFAGSRPGYIIFMLLLIGPLALTLLWTSPYFSRQAKIIWTVAVILIAVFVLWALGPTSDLLEQKMQELQALQESLP